MIEIPFVWTGYNPFVNVKETPKLCFIVMLSADSLNMAIEPIYTYYQIILKATQLFLLG